jgi:MFS family permease
VPPPADAPPPSLRGIAEGIRYAASPSELNGTYGVDIVAMFFGMPIALFPALAQRFGGAGMLGLLYTAPSIGALLATLTSGWTSRVHRHGAAVCLAAVGWGAGADMLSGVFRSAIWNQTIPDRLRGRLAGIEQISYSTGPMLGNVEAGAVASLAGLRASIVSGGVLCIAGVGVAVALLPAFWRYDARHGVATEGSD